MSDSLTPERQLRHYAEAFNDGIEKAALNLQRKADKIRVGGSHTAETMARVFEAEAEEILALRRDA